MSNLPSDICRCTNVTCKKDCRRKEPSDSEYQSYSCFCPENPKGDCNYFIARPSVIEEMFNEIMPEVEFIDCENVKKFTKEMTGEELNNHILRRWSENTY